MRVTGSIAWPLVRVTNSTAWIPGESDQLYSMAPGEGNHRTRARCILGQENF